MVANTYIYDLSARWTNGSTTYNAFKLNVIDANTSAANSNIFHLLYNSNSMFRVKKDGTVYTKAVSVTGNVSITGIVTAVGNTSITGILSVAGNTSVNGSLSFSNTSTVGLIVNVLTSAQISALSSPANGSVVFNSSSNKLMVYYNAAWTNIAVE